MSMNAERFCTFRHRNWSRSWGQAGMNLIKYIYFFLSCILLKIPPLLLHRWMIAARFTSACFLHPNNNLIFFWHKPAHKEWIYLRGCMRCLLGAAQYNQLSAYCAGWGSSVSGIRILTAPDSPSLGGNFSQLSTSGFECDPWTWQSSACASLEATCSIFSLSALSCERMIRMIIRALEIHLHQLLTATSSTPVWRFAKGKCSDVT